MGLPAHPRRGPGPRVPLRDHGRAHRRRRHVERPTQRRRPEPAGHDGHENVNTTKKNYENEARYPQNLYGDRWLLRALEDSLAVSRLGRTLAGASAPSSFSTAAPPWGISRREVVPSGRRDPRHRCRTRTSADDGSTRPADTVERGRVVPSGFSYEPRFARFGRLASPSRLLVTCGSNPSVPLPLDGGREAARRDLKTWRRPGTS